MNLKRKEPSSFTQQNANKKQCIKSWCRELAQPLNSVNNTLLFQNTSIEWGMSQDKRPVIRMYGITEKGNSVLCHVHGFLPYAYVQIPANHKFEEVDLSDFKKNLIEFSKIDAEIIYKCEIVRRRSIYGYHEDEEDFIKVTLTDPRELSKLNVDDGLELFESNMDFTLRFMIDANIEGMSWVELPVDSYYIQPHDSSQCQYEVNIQYDQIIAHRPEGQFASIAPLRIFSFDIESEGLEHKKHKVIQIANVVSVHGEKEPRAKVIFTLKGCTSIEGAFVKSYDDEKLLLMAW